MKIECQIDNSDLVCQKMEMIEQLETDRKKVFDLAYTIAFDNKDSCLVDHINEIAILSSEKK